MIVGLVEGGRYVLEGNAEGGYIVDRLNIEGFFDLGVRCSKEMEDNENGN